MAEVLETRPAIGWFEVHSESYIGGGPQLGRLLSIRRDYALSLHGVGLSLGTAEGLDRAHLARLKELIEKTEPFLVSEHLSWSVTEGTYLNDLLPLPYTEETLDVVSRNVSLMQETLGRRILVENPSAYLRFRNSTIPEAEFLAELVRRTGCGLLCDVNNIYVSCTNLEEDAPAYLEALPPQAVGEIHLAGHFRGERRGRPLLIDDHGSSVAAEVWALYRAALERMGPVPSLVEWDKNLPTWPVLLAEARAAERVAASTTWPMPALSELQRDFCRALLEGEQASVAPLVLADGLAVEERLAVYRNNVLSSLTAVLKETFPVVCRLVDERFFGYAAHEFLRAHPPERPCLAEYGGRFPDFLAAFAPCRELIYLPDVARLEWLMHAAAYAADVPALLPQSLHGIAPQDTPRLVFGLHASLGLIASPWPIDCIWRANRPGAASEEEIDLAVGAVWLEVRRSGDAVVLRALSAATFAFRQALRDDKTLDAATEAAVTEDRGFDLAANFADLFREGAVIAYTLALPAPEGALS